MSEPFNKAALEAETFEHICIMCSAHKDNPEAVVRRVNEALIAHYAVIRAIDEYKWALGYQ